MSLPRVLFCKSSKMFPSPEWTSRRVLSWDCGGGRYGEREMGICLLLLAAEAVRDREKCRKEGCSLHPELPRIAVNNIHAWRSPHPRPERVETPRRGSGEVPQKFPAVAKCRLPDGNKVVEMGVRFSERSRGLKNAASRAGQRVNPSV